MTPPADLQDLSRCAVHTMTNKPWTLAECCEAYAASGIGGISVWRNVIEPIGLDEAVRVVRGSGLRVPALVRGGFFVHPDSSARDRALDDNRTCLDEAAALGAEMVVLVVGADPTVPLDRARGLVRESIEVLVHDAQSRGVRLAIEPLHPMYAADKSCINRLGEARRLCEQVSHPVLGIAVDVYHVWWDPDLREEIGLIGTGGRLFGFHVCDWRVPTRHLLTDRAIMGEGCIDTRAIRAMVEDAGFDGFNEIEIFSEEHWATDQSEFLERLTTAYRRHV